MNIERLRALLELEEKSTENLKRLEGWSLPAYVNAIIQRLARINELIMKEL